MTFKLQIILCVIFVIAFLRLISLLVQKKFDFRFLFSWIILDVILFILSAAPVLLNLLSKLFGIYEPMNFVFFSGFALSLIIIFSITTVCSKLMAEVRVLTQKIALLEKELLNLKESTEEKDK